MGPHAGLGCQMPHPPRVDCDHLPLALPLDRVGEGDQGGKGGYGAGDGPSEEEDGV
jgi:hypothetical protein